MERDCSDLVAFFLNSIKDRLESRFAKTTLHPPLLITLESGTKPLRSVIKGIAEWFMDALQISASHEDLDAPLAI